MNTFLEKCLRGEANPDDIDDFIDRWHEDSLTLDSLSTYLGLSRKEYANWLTNPASLSALIETRKQQTSQPIPAGPQRGFCRYSLSKAAATNELNEIGFGLYDLVDGGTFGEMGIVWYKQPNQKMLVPRLQVWHDGWHTLASFTDVIQAMAKIQHSKPGGQYITEAEMADLLLSLGFVDLTTYP